MHDHFCSCLISQVLPKIFHNISKIFTVTSTIFSCISYVVHSEASLPNISMEDFLYLRNSSTELQILVDSLTCFEVFEKCRIYQHSNCPSPRELYIFFWNIRIFNSPTVQAIESSLFFFEILECSIVQLSQSNSKKRSKKL